MDRGSTYELVSACDAHRALIEEYEAIAAAGVDKAWVAKVEERARASRFWRTPALVASVILVLGFSGCVVATCSSIVEKGYHPGAGYP